MAGNAAKKDIIEIAPIELERCKIKIVGDSSLIMHAWSAKAKRQILEVEIGTPKTKAREAKNPVEDFVSSMYWLTPMPEEMEYDAVMEAIGNGARFGFPVTAFKQAAISAAYRMGWAKDKMSLRGAFFIEPTNDGYYSGDLVIGDNKTITITPNIFKYEPMVEIFYSELTMREDMVTVGMGSADIRYRGEFHNWSANMTVSFNKNGKFTMSQVINVINAGGFTCGVGEWRPEKDGQFGMYHVENA